MTPEQIPGPSTPDTAAAIEGAHDIDTALFDVDGTLVDTNYQHAMAWYRSLRRHGLTAPLWQLHRGIGMGGDQYVAHLLGQEVEDRLGDELRAGHTEEFNALIEECSALEGARDLLVAVKERGFRVVLASSGQRPHIEHFIDLLDARDVLDSYTTSDDVQNSKPAPDLVVTALQSVEGARGILVGDSTWDCKAAANAGVPTLAVRTGGFGADELTDAGALAVFGSLTELRDNLDTTALARAIQKAPA